MAKLYFTKQLMTSEYDIGIYFKTERERNLYFNIPSIFDFSKDFNFNISGGLSATLYWNEPTFLNTSILEYNYVIIDVNRQYYFYFINSAKCVTANQYQIELELDVITTYLPSLKFEDCFIERAHADRWQLKGTNYHFNFSTSSPLLRKAQAYTQFLKYRNRLIPSLNYTGTHPDFGKIINYMYVFVKLDETEQGVIYTWNNGLSKVQFPYKIYCYPLTYPSDSNIVLHYTRVTNVSETVTEEIATKFTREYYPQGLNTANIIGVTYSNFCPFSSTTEINCDTSSIINIITSENELVNSFSLSLTSSSKKVLKIDYINIDIKDYEIASNGTFTANEPKFTFTKDEIKNNTNPLMTCPILLKKSCRRLELSNYFGTSYDYSYEDINTNEIKAKVLLYPFPSVEYQYAFIEGASDSLLQKQQENLTGLVGSLDNTLLYKVEQIDEFFASNKNYYQSRQINLGLGIANAAASAVKGTASSVASFASGNVAKGASQAVGTLVDAGMNTANLIMNEKLQDLQLDNLENAPDKLNNLNGAPLTAFALYKIGFTLNVYDILDEDKKFIANDYYEHGQDIGLWDNPLNYLGKNKYFNYLKCNLKEMFYNVSPYDPIPNVIKDKIKQIFANGIRLFNGINPINIINSSSYLENYENYLDE